MAIKKKQPSKGIKAVKAVKKPAPPKPPITKGAKPAPLKEKQAAREIKDALKKVKAILATQPAGSWLRQMDSTIAALLAVLKDGPGGGPPPC